MVNGTRMENKQKPIGLGMLKNEQVMIALWIQVIKEEVEKGDLGCEALN